MIGYFRTVGTALACLLAIVRFGFGHELRGRVVDSSQRPIAAAQIRLQGLDDRIHPRIVSVNRVGEYRFDGVASGLYEIVAFADGFADTYVKNIHLTDQRLQEVPDIELGFGISLSSCSMIGQPLVFDILPNSSGQGGLQGVLQDGAGAPLTAVSITVLAAAGKNKVGATVSDLSGRFSIAALKPGRDYVIEASSPVFFLERLTNVAIHSGLRTVVPTIVLEACKPGQCQPYLKQVRVLPFCD